MTDTFSNFTVGLTSPAVEGFAITPNNNNDLNYVTRGIYVGVSGNLKVDMVDGGTITFVNLVAGIIHPIRVKRIYETDTTATSIIGVY